MAASRSSVTATIIGVVRTLSYPGQAIVFVRFAQPFGSASYRFFTRVMLSGGVAYRYEDYLRNVDEDDEDLFTGTDAEGQGQARQDDQVNLFANLTFGITRYASFYVNGIYTVNESTIDDFDYDRYRISAGVALKY